MPGKGPLFSCGWNQWMLRTQSGRRQASPTTCFWMDLVGMLVDQGPMAGLCLQNVDRFDYVIVGAHAQRSDKGRIALHAFYLIADRLTFRGELGYITCYLCPFYCIGIHVNDVVGRGIELAWIDDGLPFRLQLCFEALDKCLSACILHASEEGRADHRPLTGRTHSLWQVHVGNARTAKDASFVPLTPQLGDETQQGVGWRANSEQ